MSTCCGWELSDGNQGRDLLCLEPSEDAKPSVDDNVIKREQTKSESSSRNRRCFRT